MSLPPQRSGSVLAQARITARTLAGAQGTGGGPGATMPQFGQTTGRGGLPGGGSPLSTGGGSTTVGGGATTTTAGASTVSRFGTTRRARGVGVAAGTGAGIAVGTAATT